MKITFRKKIIQSQDHQVLLEMIERDLRSHDLKSIQIVKGDLVYETFNMFHYCSFHKYGLVDSGRFYFRSKHDLFLCCSVVSYRVWVTVVFVFLFFAVSSELSLALVFSTIALLFSAAVIWIQHYVFFKRLSRNI